MPEEPNFVLHRDVALARAAADRLYRDTEVLLLQLLPVAADIRHVGATAIPGSLTKGDLDIVVRVEPACFQEVDEALGRKFARNTGSIRSDSFAAFEDVASMPPLGIQLTAMGGTFDHFHDFVDALRSDPGLVERYNALKLKHDGQPMDVYRAAKSAFVEDVLASR